MSSTTVTPTISSGSYLNAIKTVTAPLIRPTTSQVASVAPITVQTAGRRKNTRRKRAHSKKSNGKSSAKQ